MVVRAARRLRHIIKSPHGDIRRHAQAQPMPDRVNDAKDQCVAFADDDLGRHGDRAILQRVMHQPVAEKLASEYGAKARSLNATLSDPTIDAVAKTVLCKKPVELILEPAQQRLKAVEGTGKPLMIGLDRRFDPNFAALMASVPKGPTGMAEFLAMILFDPASPSMSCIKLSGLMFRDMLIHDFDLANFLTGKASVTVRVVAPEISDAGVKQKPVGLVVPIPDADAFGPPIQSTV